MKKFKFITSIILLISLINTVLAKDFTDLTAEDSSYEAAKHFLDNGCLSGYQDGSFKPEKSINRMESVKLILTCLEQPPLYTEKEFELKKDTVVLLNNKEEKLDSDQTVVFKVPFNSEQFGNLTFPDIDQQAWYIPYLKEAVVRKIITGYNDNTIKPNNEVSKAELFAILYRITPSTVLDTFTIDQNIKTNDLDPNQWFYTSAMFALQNEITSLNSEQNYNYEYKLNRADFIQAVYKYKNWLNKKLNPTQEVIKEVKVIKEVEAKPETEEQSTQTEETTEPVTEDSNTATSSNTSSEDLSNFNESGVASYYSRNLTGAKTASGEIFDAEELVAAHKTLPFGTIVKVTNPENNKWVKVRIIDRGPYIDGRVIDLSPSAFESLASLSAGLVKVVLTIENE